ncbi:MAG: YeeE/YedE family protein [Chitinophagaceae bacterium]|nr:YeeE/YedE family protein [Chitinophagaceae bacterium]
MQTIQQNIATINAVNENADMVANTDFEVRSLDTMCVNESQQTHPWWYNFKYMIVGIVFGIVFVKAEIISWFRMQEMFRLQSFHMYGVIGTAVVVGIISIWLIRKFNIKTIYGEKIEFHPKKSNKGHIYGGLLFGLGWALTGACPGPIFAQIATGAYVVIVVLLSAIAGTWVYGYFREKLPH